MAKPWETAPRRTSRSKLRLIFKMLLAYAVYLIFWGCPGAGTTESQYATFSPLRPCATLHSIYDTQLSPLWNEYGQPFYEKVEPYSTPVILKLEPISAKARDTFRGHVGPHYDHIKGTVCQHLKPVEPHFEAAKRVISKYVTLSTPYVEKALVTAWGHIKVLYAKAAELYLAHVAPKLTAYLSELDKRQVALVADCANWANQKYEEALHEAHKWLSERVADNISGLNTAPSTPLSTDELTTDNSATESTPVSTSTPPSASTEIASTIPLGSTDADDFIQSPTSTSAQISQAKKIQIGKATGPGVREAPIKHNVPRRISWPTRVTRTANSAKKNLEADAQEYQSTVIADAKPGIMKKLRTLSKYGEEKVKELLELVTEVEADEYEIKNDAEFYDNFDSVAKHTQSLMTSVRTDCEALAQNVIDKVGELRKESLESLDDFFDIVLIEAGKEVADDDSNDSEDDEDDWAKWQAYSKLKKQISQTRKEIEDYEPGMETVNTALRESQQAAILLTQEFIQHIKTLRARAQFHIQQKAFLRAQKQGDEPIDVEWQVIGEDGETLESSTEAPDLESTGSKSESELESSVETEVEGDDEEEIYTETVTSLIYETRTGSQTPLI